LFCIILDKQKMTKVSRKKRKTKSSAWKKLISQHKKGPKRIKLQNPRFKQGVDPLNILENVKRVQIILKTECNPKYISVVMFNQSFSNIGLHSGDNISMPMDKLRRAGHAFRNIFDIFGHNERILGAEKEKKLGGLIGRCIMFTEKFKICDATITILPSKEELMKREATNNYISKIFNRSLCGKHVVDVEYI